MRQVRDRVFIAVLVLSVISSTSVALLAVSGAFGRPTAQLISGGGDFTGSGAATATAGGSSGGGSSGGGGVPQGGQSNGVTHDTITIGAIYSESNGIDATVEQHTVEACFNYYNSRGGINGHQLKLVSYDDGLNGDQAYAEAARLDQQNHVFAVVGWLAPFGEARAAPYFESKGIPIIGGLGVPEEFNSRYSFPVSPIFYRDGYLLGQYATRSGGPLHFKHPGVFLTQTAGINDVANGMKAGAKSNGVTINNNDIIFVPFAATNFDQYLLQFQQEGVDGLITQLDPFSYVRLYQSEQRTNKLFPHLGGAGIDKQSVDSAIGSPLVGTYSFMPVLEAQGNPAGNAEVALYNQVVAGYISHHPPDSPANMDAFSEGSWVACRVFAQALAKLGANVTREGLVQALSHGVYSVGGMAPPFNWGAAGSSHAAANCASFIQYTSSQRWKIVQGFTC